MSDKDEEAQELAGRAGRQAKSAAKNAGRATAAAAEDVADEAKETVQDAARQARRVNVGMIGHITSDLSIGFFATTVSIYSGVIAYHKFRQAFAGRSNVVS